MTTQTSAKVIGYQGSVPNFGNGEMYIAAERESQARIDTVFAYKNSSHSRSSNARYNQTPMRETSRSFSNTSLARSGKRRYSAKVTESAYLASPLQQLSQYTSQQLAQALMLKEGIG